MIFILLIALHLSGVLAVLAAIGAMTSYKTHSSDEAFVVFSIALFWPVSIPAILLGLGAVALGTYVGEKLK